MEGCSFFRGLLSESSKEAAVNARLSRVGAPIEGRLHLDAVAPGRPVVSGEQLGLIRSQRDDARTLQQWRHQIDLLLARRTEREQRLADLEETESATLVYRLGGLFLDFLRRLGTPHRHLR